MTHHFYHKVISDAYLVAFLFALGTNSDGEAFVLFIIGIFFGIAVYYLLARIGIWVYNGFNDQKPNL